MVLHVFVSCTVMLSTCIYYLKYDWGISCTVSSLLQLWYFNDCRAGQEDDMHVCTHTHMQREMLFLMGEKTETGILSLSMTSFTNWLSTVLIQNDHCNNLKKKKFPFLFLLTTWFVFFSWAIGNYSHQLLCDFLGYDLLKIFILSFLINKYYQAYIN